MPKECCSQTLKQCYRPKKHHGSSIQPEHADIKLRHPNKIVRNAEADRMETAIEEGMK